MQFKKARPKPLVSYGLLWALCLSFLLLFAVSAFGADNEVIVDYSFESPYVEPVTVGGTGYDQVIMPGVAICGNTGEPLLPALGAKILLPPQTEVESIEIIPGEEVRLGDGYSVQPAARPYRLSFPEDASLPEPNPDIYDSDNPFPAALYEQIGVQTFRGYSILVLKLNPVIYSPKSGQIVYYRDFQVKVTTRPSDKSDDLYRGFDKDKDVVMKKVDNPRAVSDYNILPGKSPTDTYDLLIITTRALEPSFEPLITYHESMGTSTIVMTDKTISLESADNIRNVIRNAYENYGIEYVLIGGDDDVIPAADLYVKSWSGSGAYTETDMPGDVFYACLDGTWNYDNDAYWGETNDGDNGGDVDLSAEVYVGRAAVGTTSEVTIFVNKTLAYANLSTSTPYLQNICLVGEYLGFGGLGDWGGNHMDELEDSSSANSYSTIGIPTDQYTVDELYDRDWTGNDWPKSEMKSRINAGRHLICHLGHGNTTYGLKMYNSDAATLTNTDYCFIYSQTCLAGHLDGLDCFAEAMTIKYMSGAFAVIMNSRYGWGENYSTDGPSQRYNREFIDAIYGENIKSFGKANQDSKEDNLYRVNQDCMRWCYYEINLFGDPVITMKSNCVDADGDGYADPGYATAECPLDNCPDTYNTDQIDSDGDGYGDACDLCAGFDDDIDADGDGMPDLCDLCPGYDDFLDDDSDGRPNDCDNCPLVANEQQEDNDGDGVGDACDACPGYDDAIDADGDDVPDGCDQCPGYDDRADADTDGAPDGCDNCPEDANPFQEDSDEDGVGDACDICQGYDDAVDADNDGVPDGCDICPGYDDFADNDSDGVPDGCDQCAGYDDNVDTDEDTIADGCDNCPNKANTQQEDADDDGVGDVCDNCINNKNINQDDVDEDGTGDVCDNCPDHYNQDQADGDDDTVGDVCDNCLNTYNPGQEDADGNEVGDACDWMCGDVNADALVNVSDAVKIVNYVFIGGEPPDPLDAGNVNCDEAVNVSDAVYLINYIFISGAAPCDCE